MSLFYKIYFFFLMIRRPPRSTHCISSAASDVYKRQAYADEPRMRRRLRDGGIEGHERRASMTVSYTHLRAHETRHDLVCRLLLEKKKKTKNTEQDNSTQHIRRIQTTTTSTATTRT
eukprot:TRINITY_DN9206_c0_g1_i3.p3 TRINITY_DN9206_c0_g1~~TRINITY_DN9206_c0_g1_i3.p3  ORF type:complete len:117 (-),score=18.10 TRINITY_DN9206_c0_g1_i3:6-356(-)